MIYRNVSLSIVIIVYIKKYSFTIPFSRVWTCALNDSAGHGCTSHFNNLFRVLMQRNAVFATEEGPIFLEMLLK